MAYRWDKATKAWRVTVDRSPDPLTGRRRRATKLVREPHNKAGERAAKLVEAQMLVDVAAETVTDSSAPLAVVAEAWYARGGNPTWKPRTAEGYRRLLDARVIPRWGSTALGDIRRGDIVAWHDEMLKTTSLPTTRRTHAVLRQVLTFAVEREWIAANPAAGRMLAQERREASEAMTVEQMRSVIAKVPEGWRAEMCDMIELAALTGMRRGELCGLRWSDVDRDGKVLHVRRSISQVARGEPEAVEPKTHQRRRVPIGDAELAILDRRPVTAGGYLWSDAPDGSLPWPPNRVTDLWIEARDAAEVPYRFHDLRHLCATLLLAAGVPVKTVQDRLGHHSAQMTTDVYAHAMPADGHDAADLLGRLLGTGAA